MCGYTINNANTDQVLFTEDLINGGDSDIASFLSIIAALKICRENNLRISVYTTSKVALDWIKTEKVQSDKISGTLLDRFGEDFKWLQNTYIPNQVLDWSEKKQDRPQSFFKRRKTNIVKR